MPGVWMGAQRRGPLVLFARLRLDLEHVPHSRAVPRLRQAVDLHRLSDV